MTASASGQFITSLPLGSEIDAPIEIVGAVRVRVLLVVEESVAKLPVPAVSKVSELLACSSRLPLDSRAAMAPTEMVLALRSAKPHRPPLTPDGAAALPGSTMMSVGSNSSVPALPFAASRSTDPV